MNVRGALVALATLTMAGLSAVAGPFGDNRSGIHMTSEVFRAWISGVTAFSHPTNSGGNARSDDYAMVPPDAALSGQPDDPSSIATHVVSLGAGGSIVLRFDEAIQDGPGPDFAVFENGILDGERSEDTNQFLFAELAYVEVATRTNHWARFPAQSLGTEPVFNATTTNGYASMDVTLVDGLAGKHRPEFGTPFDLAALRSLPNVTNGLVDLSCIRFIRLVDIIGNGLALDASNRPIFDPYYSSFAGYPEPAPPSIIDGFDLRAIGLINSGGLTMKAGADPALVWFAATNSTWQVQQASDPRGPWSNTAFVVAGDDTNHVVTPPPGNCSFYRLHRWSTP